MTATPPSRESLSEESDCSEDSIHIDAVLDWDIDPDDDRLTYLCVNSDGAEEYYDRSDLMDGAKHQKLVLAFEKKHPPPWDPFCTFCGGHGCEECHCPDCERECRFFRGVNYGCPLHPVV